MPEIDNEYFIMTNTQYKTGIALEEYNGRFSLVSARQNKDGQIWADWAFPQTYEDGKWIPKDKSMPVKVPLGESREEAIQTLKDALNLFNVKVALDDTNKQTTPPDDYEDIPF